jgi:hypothetical protein
LRLQQPKDITAEKPLLAPPDAFEQRLVRFVRFRHPFSHKYALNRDAAQTGVDRIHQLHLWSVCQDNECIGMLGDLFNGFLSVRDLLLGAAAVVEWDVSAIGSLGRIAVRVAASVLAFRLPPHNSTPRVWVFWLRNRAYPPLLPAGAFLRLGWALFRTS